VHFERLAKKKRKGDPGGLVSPTYAARNPKKKKNIKANKIVEKKKPPKKKRAWGNQRALLGSRRRGEFQKERGADGDTTPLTRRMWARFGQRLGCSLKWRRKQKGDISLLLRKKLRTVLKSTTE